MADQKHHDEHEKSEIATLSPATTEQERELAQQATAEFERGQYENCLSTITKLSETRGYDLKVIHNQAIAAYYLSGLIKTDEFKSALNDVYSKVSLDEIAALDDVDQCIIYYNHAVILFYTKQYKAAFGLLDKVMHFIEPMDENVSRKVTFLMVELYLAIHQPYKALQMIAFIEKAQLGANKSSSPDKDKDDVSRETKEGSSEPPSDSWKATISQYKVRCFLMMKSMKSCKREMKTFLGSAGSSMSMTFLKSQLEYMRGNFQKAIRILCSVSAQVMNVPRSSPLPIHCARRNAAAMYYSNLGVLHFHMRKHNLGLFYMRRALEENKKAITGEQSGAAAGRSLYELGISRHYEIMYNLGVQLLHCGQPQAAFDCLLETVQQFQVNPYLWLRLAECCIMVHRANNDVDRSHTKKMEVVSGSIGSGIHRKLILGTGVRVDKLSAVLDSMAIPMASMEFAGLCLDNALILLPESATSAQTPASDVQTGETKTSADSILLVAPPGNPLKADDIASLRCSVLASRAYVALYHRDYVIALEYAQKLLRQPRLSGAHKYLGHMYVAESLVALDRIADSIDHLNADLITDVSTVFPVDLKQEQDKSDKNGEADGSDQTEFQGARYPWSPSSVAQAKAIMVYNLAVTHTVRGEHEKGLQNLDKITQSIGHPRPAQMYYLKIYLELLEGRRKMLQTVLRDHFGHIATSR